MDTKQGNNRTDAFRSFQHILLALRAITCLMLALFALAWYAEWGSELSAEALRYQNDYPDAIRSGFAWTFAISKAAFGVGIAAALVGSILVMLQKRGGLIPLVAFAPLLALGAQLNAPPSDYPSVEPLPVLLLWCGASAAWASTVTLAWIILYGRRS